MSQHEWLEKDFYKTLGVKKDVSEKDLTKAYRKLARKYHPDANPGDVKAEERFKEISAAYDVVGDEARRKEYDEIRRLGPAAGFGGFGGGGRGTAGGAYGSRDATQGFNFDGVDLGDLLGGVFGRGGGGQQAGGRARQAAQAEKGSDLETHLHLSFDDAIAGVTTSVHLTSDAACSTCKGNGAKPGTRPEACSRCGGRGVLDDNQGMFSFSQPCPQCGGRGRVVTDPCTTCRGSGMERRPRQVKVRVPAGVKDGQKIKLKGRGAPGRNGGPHGDLFVKIAVAPHELFGRDGLNLTLDFPITYPDAALGTKISVPTMSGKNVTLKVPAGTPSGKTFRVKGRGVTSGTKTGDLLVTVDVKVPTSLTDAEREAIEALRDAEPVDPPTAATANEGATSEGGDA